MSNNNYAPKISSRLLQDVENVDKNSLKKTQTLNRGQTLAEIRKSNVKLNHTPGPKNRSALLQQVRKKTQLQLRKSNTFDRRALLQDIRRKDVNLQKVTVCNRSNLLNDIRKWKRVNNVDIDESKSKNVSHLLQDIRRFDISSLQPQNENLEQRLAKSKLYKQELEANMKKQVE